MRVEHRAHPADAIGAANVIYESSISLTAEQSYTSEGYFQDWEQGPFAHLTHLSVPQNAAKFGFHFNASGYLIDEFLTAYVYCDSLTGTSGRNLDRDPIVADLVTSGWIEFSRADERHLIKPGEICIRDTKASWEFSCPPGTVVRVISIPRHLVGIESIKSLKRAFLSNFDAPEVRFLVNFLEAITESKTELEASTTAQLMARDTCASMVSSILSGSSDFGISDRYGAVTTAARNVIERNIAKNELSAPMIARSIGVSLRTLHRAFSETGEPVMAFARHRRLQKARDELVANGNTTSIAAIALRWNFSDASHFIRQFKSYYGVTPRSYLKNHKDSRIPKK
ncbi:helix-turn-helix transcriptional regulator [Streptomyces sp. NPDC088354]|uniref:helix-turn-helix transcriptional regulator n=1 Tax=Streptomyces sp. NPDC088354 TaxID=3365856 RepID=UPI003808A238